MATEEDVNLNPLCLQADCRGAIFHIQFNSVSTTMLYDTGASRSCISTVLYKSLDQAPPLTPMDFLKVQGANGNDLQPLGVIQGTITLGCTDITHQFIVLNSIRIPLILGIDFQKKHGCSSSWTQDGQMQIKWENAVTINSVATSEEHPIVPLCTSKHLCPSQRCGCSPNYCQRTDHRGHRVSVQNRTNQRVQ